MYVLFCREFFVVALLIHVCLLLLRVAVAVGVVRGVGLRGSRLCVSGSSLIESLLGFRASGFGQDVTKILLW